MNESINQHVIVKLIDIQFIKQMRYLANAILTMLYLRGDTQMSKFRGTNEFSSRGCTMI